MRDEGANPWSEAQEESYYISITDMLIGLLFLFIIMLMYFAAQLRETAQDLVTTEQTRSELIEKVAGYLQERNVLAETDVAAGVLRLPDAILFDKGRDAPKAEGESALKVLSEALMTHLPCYAFRAGNARPESCGDTSHHVEAIFIEGHTDSDRIVATARLRDNWDLSAARASNTLRIMTSYRADLASFLSADPASANAQPVFSVAGYADQRPVAPGDDEAAKSRNRRIDLRFLMALPESPE